MPIYEYECPEGHRFEAITYSIHSGSVECLVCDKPAQKRPSLIASYSIQGDNSASVTPRKFRSEDDE